LRVVLPLLLLEKQAALDLQVATVLRTRQAVSSRVVAVVVVAVRVKT
jgi:hypothetical protein